MTFFPSHPHSNPSTLFSYKNKNKNRRLSFCSSINLVSLRVNIEDRVINVCLFTDK
uniref:Uncharacterized protein n=1 Tax=Anguilla anguilla TaxID=7936 RepID=A0A0E9SX79_ANGAN